MSTVCRKANHISHVNNGEQSTKCVQSFNMFSDGIHSPGPEFIKLFFVLNSAEQESFYCLACSYIAEKFSCPAIVNEKEVGIAGYLRFNSRKNFMLS